MSMIFCHNCNKNVDTDFNVEHFTEDEECIKSQEIMVNKAEYIELKLSCVILKAALQEVSEQIPLRINTALVRIIKDITDKALKLTQ